MDPLSVTLAVITLATALKDIIETASAIQDAFSKHPQNYKNAQRLSKSILVTLEELNEIYEEKKAVVDKKPSLKRSIHDLLEDMKYVHQECMRLLPPVSKRKRDKFKIAFYSFWNRERVERLIADLNDRVNERLAKFTALSTIRTETHVVEMHDTLMVSSARIEAHAEEIHRNTSNGYSFGHNLGLRNSTAAHLFTFAGTSYMPMTRIPDTVPTDELSKAYLRREIGRIDMSLLLGPLLRWLRDSPEDLRLSESEWNLRMPVQPDIFLHQEAVVFAFRIQALLKESPSNDMVIRVVNVISQLCLKLQQMKMFEGLLLVRMLTATFFRDLFRQFPSQRFAINYAESLTYLAMAYSDIDDQVNVLSATEEAINVSSSLMETETDAKTIIQYNVILTQNILVQAMWESYDSRALELVARAGSHLWKAFGHDKLSAMSMSCLSPGDWIKTGFRKLFHQDMSYDDYFTCSLCLFEIADIQLEHEEDTQSNYSAKLSLQIAKYLLHKFPNSERIQNLIHNVLKHLSEPTIRSLNTLGENRRYIHKNTTILRKLVQIRPHTYSIPFANALWSEWEVLMELGRSDDAEAVYQEMSNLGRFAEMPSHLSIKIPSKIEGDYFLTIFHSHYTTKRFTDAISAARNAVAQYSAVALIDPKHDPNDHISALACLCQSLTAANQHAEAILESLNTLNIISRYTDSGLTLIDSHHLHEVLNAFADAVCACLRQEAPTYSKIVNIHECLRRIASSGNIESWWKLTQAILDYTVPFWEKGMVEEAFSYYMDLRNDDSDLFMGMYFGYLDQICRELGVLGEVNVALRNNEEACSRIQQLLASFHGVSGMNPFRVLQITTSNRIKLLCDASQYDEAMELSKAWVEEIHRHPEHSTIKDRVESLSTLSFTQCLNLMPHAAYDSAVDSLNLSRSLNDGELIHHSLICLAFAYADSGNVDRAIQILDIVENVIKIQYSISSIEELQDHYENGYLTILSLRSKLLFAKKEYTEAAVLVKIVEAIQRENSKTDPYAAKDSGNTLMYSRILFCALGRHEEGFAAATELNEIQSKLEVSSPKVGRMLQNELDNTVERGWWQPVQQVKNNLTCGHQDHFRFLTLTSFLLCPLPMDKPHNPQ
ncbi:hypothetical protein BDN70DRAFT_920418 [Pholiota conissans]|uniref:Uncharacterized protein n=1 Tax=Pholiota conissans TaxID=109636 RepID=A0A9P6D1V6_9AGAR|nr:hypothetical protein BDN70DRAFT_920418 [Pholiota conissans]